MSLAINFAKALGWNSIAAAAVFSVLYSPLLVYFLSMIIKERRRVLFSLTLFCLIRVAAFVMRAISIGITSAGENEGLFIATEVLFSIGFFGLLYCCYSLCLDRLDLCQDTFFPVPIIGNILHLLRNRRLFRIVLLIPMALGIAGINEASSNPSSSIGTSLRKASAIVFLVLTIIQVLQTIVLIKAERENRDPLRNNSSSFGATHASFLFAIIALLLLVREIFTVITINNILKANNEHFWYPLIAVPEILCVTIFAIPGLIPPKGAQKDDGLQMYQNGNTPPKYYGA